MHTYLLLCIGGVQVYHRDQGLWVPSSGTIHLGFGGRSFTGAWGVMISLGWLENES